MSSETTSVVIVGAGPVGLILAHILGRGGVKTLVIEMAAELSDEPRAVGLDPESLRTLQALDLMDVLEDDLMHGLTGEYLNGDGELLFAITDDQPGPLGYTSLAGFNQPALVRKLARELQRYPQVEFCYEHTLQEFQHSDSGVDIQLQTPGGERRVHAEYLVGCDGGRSTVRAGLGIRMEGVSNPQPWLVIDTREPEWDGQRKYRFFCDPRRPGMFVQTPHNNRRWEWMLLPGDDRESFLKDETIHALLAPHIDASEIDIYRRRVYDFHAIIAEHFQQGRVFLAGDAAHMTPPFAGQGLNSGVRDATNLGWKLNAVLQHGVPDSVLESYECERWAHAKELIDVAVTLGEQIQPIDPEAAAMRDAAFAEMKKDDQVMDRFVGGIFDALLNRSFTEGFAIDLGGPFMAGRMISQPRVTDPAGHEELLDHYLGEGFAIIGYNCDPAQELDAAVLQRWRGWGANVVGLFDNGEDASHTLEAGSHLAELFAHDDTTMMLLRPDRFCMVAFNRKSAGSALQQAAQMLGVSE